MVDKQENSLNKEINKIFEDLKIADMEAL